jgi:hypothetical protein
LAPIVAGRPGSAPRVIDANGVRKEQYRDVRAQIVTVNEFNNGGATSGPST